jgi:hypothetical protein
VFCGRQTASGTETGPEPHPIERSSPVKRMRTSCWPSYPSHRAEPLERLVDLLPRADGQNRYSPGSSRVGQSHLPARSRKTQFHFETCVKDSPVNGTSAPVFRLMSDS